MIVALGLTLREGPWLAKQRLCPKRDSLQREARGTEGDDDK